ncbi:MAG: CRISPR-associated protein Cas5 [Victivallaceae bacterium]|nr:CRISPR-associated protein Cas5 [Victivallaceae bacterium]
MSILLFELAGDMAMWRNVYESMGSYSSLGPAPGNLAGLIGAALGFASPRSQAAAGQDWKQLKALDRKGFPWPVSSELLSWERENDFHVGCRWTGGRPRRLPWNVNGKKKLKSAKTLRIQQQVIESPRYEVAVRLSAPEALRVAEALLTPAFPLCLGASFCRAVVCNVRVAESLTDSPDWAFRADSAVAGESVPFSRHIVNADQCFERIRSDGYWIYPTPDQPGVIAAEPLVRGWVTEPEA